MDVVLHNRHASFSTQFHTHAEQDEVWYRLDVGAPTLAALHTASSQCHQ
jgi:hypothetical protein